uniref:Uncharacterized protein n=1 Tax=Gasterosteus aculeatus TaxID=69293 RepID=G3P9K9_GASAC
RFNPFFGGGARSGRKTPELFFACLLRRVPGLQLLPLRLNRIILGFKVGFHRDAGNWKIPHCPWLMTLQMHIVTHCARWIHQHQPRREALPPLFFLRVHFGIIELCATIRESW